MTEYLNTDFLTFVHVEDSPSKKTKIIGIYSVKGGEALGVIQWFAAWRKYCYYTYANTIWDTNCLNAIIECINKLMVEYKTKEKDGNADGKE